MFDDVGQELKGRAETHVAISVFKFIIIGAAVGIVVGFAVPAFTSGIGLLALCGSGIFGFYGFWKGREQALIFYSYAELVDCAVKVQAHLEQVKVKNTPTEPICEKCGSRYESDAKWCSNCGAMIKANHSTITDEDKRTAMINKWRESQLISDEEIERRMGQ